MTDAPGYPSVQGQTFPDLNLADFALNPPPIVHMPQINAGDSTPPQRTEVPALSGDGMDLMCLGVDPKLPYYDLNLAGMCDPVPMPSTIMKPTDPAMASDTIGPTFTEPNFAIPSLQAGDVVYGTPAYVPPLDADPHLGDLLQFDHPIGLNTVVSSVDPKAVDPDFAIPYDRPAGLETPNPLQPDPLLPDLQFPETRQEVYMDGRPADLSDDALSVLHLGPAYKSIDDSYPESQFDQSGDNSHRMRHQTVVVRGMDVVR